MHENLGQPSQQNFSNSPPLPFPSCLSTSYPVDSIHPPGINTPPYFPATLHLWQLSTHIKCPNFATCNMCGELNLVNRKVKPKRRVLRSKDRLVRTSSWWKDQKNEQQKTVLGTCCVTCLLWYTSQTPLRSVTSKASSNQGNILRQSFAALNLGAQRVLVPQLNFAVVSKKNSSGQASCKCVRSRKLPDWSDPGRYQTGKCCNLRSSCAAHRNSDDRCTHYAKDRHLLKARRIWHFQ